MKLVRSEKLNSKNKPKKIEENNDEAAAQNNAHYKPMVKQKNKTKTVES